MSQDLNQKFLPMDGSKSHLFPCTDVKVVFTADGRNLLADGWWGRLRHPNYLGDILVAISWALPAGLFYFVDDMFDENFMWASGPLLYPLRLVRPTRSSSYSHLVQLSLPKPRALSYKSSFIPITCRIWNSISTTFPEFNYLAIFKSKSNKLDFIPVYTLKILINGGVINISKTLLHFYQEKTNSVGNKNIFTWRKKKFLFLRKNLQTIFHSLKFNKRGVLIAPGDRKKMEN